VVVFGLPEHEADDATEEQDHAQCEQHTATQREVDLRSINTAYTYN